MSRSSRAFDYKSVAQPSSASLQTVSPPWSVGSLDSGSAGSYIGTSPIGSTGLGPAASSSNPTQTPYINTVPLPAVSGSSPRTSPSARVVALAHLWIRAHNFTSTDGLPSPPTSPQQSRHSARPVVVHPVIAPGTCVPFDLGLTLPTIFTLADSAFSPPLAQAYVRIPGSPSVITVIHPSTQALSVRRTMHEIWAFFQAPVDRLEYSSWSSQVQNSANVAFRRRTTNDPVAYAQGLKRVDVMGPNVVFTGLTPLADGTLILNLTPRQ
jgi:hypothetical protein